MPALLVTDGPPSHDAADDDPFDVNVSEEMYKLSREDAESLARNGPVRHLMHPSIQTATEQATAGRVGDAAGPFSLGILMPGRSVQVQEAAQETSRQQDSSNNDDAAFRSDQRLSMARDRDISDETQGLLNLVGMYDPLLIGEQMNDRVRSSQDGLVSCLFQSDASNASENGGRQIAASNDDVKLEFGMRRRRMPM
jgi:hypothetical protein